MESPLNELIFLPVLKLPISIGPTTLDADTHIAQIDFMLLQKDPKKTFKPVSYWPRSLTVAERKFNAKQNEFFAIVRSVFLLRPYINRTRSTIRAYSNLLM